MGASSSRKQRRQQQQKEGRQAALEAACEPSGAKPIETDVLEGPEEINFMLIPGGLLHPEGAPPLVRKAKTVRVPGPLNVHVGSFDARHMGRFNFERTTLALWRLLLREEHRQMEEARAEGRRTGLPAQPTMGPIYRALREELEQMRREESGEIFDEE